MSQLMNFVYFSVSLDEFFYKHLFICLIIYLFVWNSCRERERERFHVLVHSPRMATIAGARQVRNRKWGASSGSSLWVHMPQGLRSSSTAFPGTLSGSWIRSRTTRIWTGTLMGYWYHKWKLSLICHSTSRWMKSDSELNYFGTKSRGQTISG